MEIKGTVYILNKKISKYQPLNFKALNLPRNLKKYQIRNSYYSRYQNVHILFQH